MPILSPFTLDHAYRIDGIDSMGPKRHTLLNFSAALLNNMDCENSGDLLRYATCLRFASLVLVFACAASAQSTFTRNYKFPDTVRMACCSSIQFGLTSVVNDTTVTGPIAEITNITLAGSVYVTSPDINNSTPFDWEVFIGSSPSPLPPGQTTGNPDSISSTAPTQFHSSQSAPANAGATVNFQTSYDFGTSAFSANTTGHLVSATALPMTVMNGLYIQVFGWSGAINVDLTLSNIVVTITGTTGTTGSPPAPGQPTSTVVYQGFQGASNNLPVTYNLYPWFGNKVALLTPQNNLDVPTMNKILAGLDAAWGVYEQITGADPSPYAPGTLNGHDIIAVVPDASIPSCAACTYVGANGTELTSTYFFILYNGVMENDQFDQVMFYEFGRNFWFYGNALGAVGEFVTGFAIANRFISLDRSGLQGGPFNGLPFPQFQQSDMIDFLNSYLDNPSYTWQNTILTGVAPPSSNGWSAADLAGAMFYRLYDDFGFAAYQAFWKALQTLSSTNSPDGAIANFLSAAMTATGQNYGFLFKGAYNSPPLDLCSLTPATSRMTLGAEAFSGALSFTTSHDYCEWTVSVTSGSWVHVPVTSGTGSGTLQYSVDANTTGQARSVVIEFGGASFYLLQNATPSVAPSAVSVVNAATFAAGIAPGSWITIEGQALAFSAQVATTSPLPNTLGGVQVLVNGNAIPLDYVGPSQINAQLPYEISPGAAQFIVTNYGAASSPVTVSVSATSPGIFTAGGQAIAQNVDAATGFVTLNSIRNPVSPGGYLVLYLTGQGVLDHVIPTGATAPDSPLSSPAAKASVRIGGTDVPVLFIGMTPGLVAVCQANIQVPDNIPAGDQPVIVTIGSVDSPPAAVSIGTSQP